MARTDRRVLGGATGAAGLGVPAGGASGQVLRKKSAADNDTEWIVGGLAGNVVSTGSFVGPASYALGGITVDLTATFASLAAVYLTLEVAGVVLPLVLAQVTLNKDASGAAAAGKFAVKLLIAANTELPALTVLSGVTWRYLAVGS